MLTFTSKSGKTIILRPPLENDVQIMLDFINQIGREDIYVNVNPYNLYTFEQEYFFVKDTISKIKANQAVYYLAFDRDQLIGSCSVFKQDKRRRHLGLFGIILKQNYRQDGIGFKLAQAVIGQAIKILDLKTIILEVFEPNQIAYRLYRKLGFQEYGHLPQGLIYQDRYIDSILMYKHLDETQPPTT